MAKRSEFIIGVIGLGYVGLPLAIEFANVFPVFGFDINKVRINQLNLGIDTTKESDLEKFRKSLNYGRDESINSGLICTSNLEDLSCCNVFIITVPTPVNKNNEPDLGPLIKASAMVGTILKLNDLVIYESTVFPGCTEDECVPILEKYSRLEFNKDFFVGYSPERINPGDKIHTLSSIKKVTSGSTPKIALKVDELYNRIILAGTYLAPSIKVAEASKIVENSQRDINIAFVNELAKIFGVLGIDTIDVLQAASTKWNFLNFKPGLVGGHCTSVDPYYLAKKSQIEGYTPEIILAGRRINEGMGRYVAQEFIKLMISNDIKVQNSNILILGITFKENCADIRNTKVIDIISYLYEFNCNVFVYDPWANASSVKIEFGLDLLDSLELDIKFDGVALCVSHELFKEFDFTNYCHDKHVVYDVKGFFNIEQVNGRL